MLSNSEGMSADEAAAGVCGGGGGGAEAQYWTAKTSVWWDIENCHVPKNFNPNAIAQNISSALMKMNYSGPILIFAYGDTNRIPFSVQQAISSTGIALNHVPAGFKDASDKKILVDMLFWAVDNPAPANYFLISGDRDFSNALHQLRLRKYNILLAQPYKVSPALVAAARSVWLWTSLIAGGPPLSTGDLANGTSTIQRETSQTLVPDILPSNQPTNGASGGHNFVSPAKTPDTKSKVKHIPKNLNQLSLTRVSSMPDRPLENNKVQDPQQPENALPDQVKRAPHEFFGPSMNTISSSRSAPNLLPGNHDPSTNSRNLENLQNQFTKPQPPLARDTISRDNAQNQFTKPQPPFARDINSRDNALHLTPRPNASKVSPPQYRNLPDIGNLSLSSNPNYSQNAHSSHRRNGLEYRPKSLESKNIASSHRAQNSCSSSTSQLIHDNNLINKFSGSSLMDSKSVFSKGVLGNQGFQPPSEYVQGLIGIVLLALHNLKLEKIMPTEANIANCIRYEDKKYRVTDAKKALDCAIEHQMIIKQNLGAVQLYIGRVEKLWRCVNPIGGNSNQYPMTTWDAIEKFLASSAGRSAMMKSECRYEAALMLKNACLKMLPLGEVLQILDMIITMKKWIIEAQTGWQPITITVAEINNDTSYGDGA